MTPGWTAAQTVALCEQHTMWVLAALEALMLGETAEAQAHLQRVLASSREVILQLTGGTA